MTPTQKLLYQALIDSGWSHPEVAINDSLSDLGFDSLALALWVAEMERKVQVTVPYSLLTLDRWETIEKASQILEPILKAVSA